MSSEWPSPAAASKEGNLRQGLLSGGEPQDWAEQIAPPFRELATQCAELPVNSSRMFGGSKAEH
jgi:hypothetical protein